MDPRAPVFEPTVFEPTEVEPTDAPELVATTREGRPPLGEQALSRGALVGRYVILERLGAGAMGVVYGAYDPELDRKIALKFLKSDRGDIEARARLLREAQAMARVVHPNVITVHDVGTFGERVFVAMEFVQGVTLRQWLSERPRGWQEIVAVFVAAGRGLAAAHEAGLVHRDLKPENIMLGSDERVRVMDFGLARASATATTDAPPGTSGPSAGPDAIVLTRTGALLGTPPYMAPEQWRFREADARSDQFSFCVALWEALYGERPFRGETLSVLMTAITSGALTLPGNPRAAPRWLRLLLERGLSTKASDRWPSMSALLAELSRDRQVRLRRRAAAVVGVLVVLTGGLGVQQVVEKRATAVAERERAERAEAEALTLAGQQAEERERQNLLLRQAEAERTEQLYRSLLVQAGAGQRSLEPGRRFAGLEAIAEAARQAQERGVFAERQRTLRDAAIASLGLVDARRTKRWHAQAFGTPGFDSRLEHVAIPLRGDEFSIRRVADDVEVWRFPSPGHNTWYMAARYFLGDTHLNLHYADRDVPAYWHVYDMRGSAPIERLYLRDALVSETDGGRTLWRVGVDGHLLALDTDSGRVIRRLDTRFDPRSIHQLRAHEDGRYLALADDKRQAIHIVDLDADRIVSTMKAERDAWAWGQDDMFAIGEADQISLWDPLSGLKRGQLRGYDDRVVHLAFHPGRRLLGSCSWDGTSRFWEVSSQREVLRLDGCLLRFDAGGRGIGVQQDDDLEVWDFAAAEVLSSVPGWARSVGFSPDARSLLIAGESGVDLWDLDGFRRRWRSVRDRCAAAIFLPDGSRFVTTCEKGGVQVWTVTRAAAGVEVIMTRQLLERSSSFPVNIGTLALSTSGSPLLAAAAVDRGEVRLFDAGTLDELGRLRGEQQIRTLAISSDGRWVASAGWKSSAVQVWDRFAPGQPRRLEAGDRGFTRFDFDPAGRWLLIDARGQITKWRVGAWTEDGSAARERAMYYLLAAAPDGQTVVIEGSSTSLHLLRASDLSLIAELPKPVREIWELRFSPDSRTLAVASAENGVYLWDLHGLRRELGALGLDW